MHIQEGTNTTLTTCTKMTEEVDRRHGVNGNSSSKGANDDPPVHSSPTATATSGGRLKFFKGSFYFVLFRLFMWIILAIKFIFSIGFSNSKYLLLTYV